MTRTIPGTDCVLEERRDEQGRLVGLRAGGREYLWQEDDGRHYDGGVVTFETALGRTLLRSVRTPHHGSWTEEYRLDAEGRPAHIDGADIQRDGRQRVVACGDWSYAYTGDHLTTIRSSAGARRVTRDADGRPIRMRERTRTVDYRYDGRGERHDAACEPDNWRRDEVGRLWTVIGPEGEVERTYLWDGFACLGRIDGPPGAPLTAVFSLDPTCTPVRVVTAERVTRIPRDAFGEALTEYPDVPGLFGGAQHAGQVRYAARSLDPRTGAFLQPDPWDGLERDPRRAEGYRGTLLVERGAYTVALNDPVGRMDPTGEASVGLYISTFTWSWQNNLVGWLAMDFFINLWGSLFGAIGNGELLDRFGDFEHLESSSTASATSSTSKAATTSARPRCDVTASG